MLELGHGTGHLQIALKQKGVWACGVDASRSMNRIAYRRLRGSDLIPNIINAQAQYLPFASHSFQQIAATFPTDYILDDRTIDEIWRILSPDGELVVIPVAWITGNGLLDRAARYLFRITGQAPEWDDRILEPVKKAGFDVEVSQKSIKGSAVLIIQACKVEV